MTDLEFDREISNLLVRSGRRLAVIAAEHRDGEIYAKAYGDGELAGKFSLTNASKSPDFIDVTTREDRVPRFIIYPPGASDEVRAAVDKLAGQTWGSE